MKRTKRLLPLLLAMMMAFSIMAVTASAYGGDDHEHTAACSEEGIMPRKPAMKCYQCNVPMTYEESKSGTRVQYRFVCPVCGDCTIWMNL